MARHNWNAHGVRHDATQHCSRDCQGVALTETLVTLIVLLPLLFLVPHLGRIGDAAHQTSQASRYLAWQATVGEGASARQDVTGRFFAAPQAHIQTGKIPTSGDDGGNGAGTGPGLWRFVDQKSGATTDAHFENVKAGETTQTFMQDVPGLDKPLVISFSEGAGLTQSDDTVPGSIASGLVTAVDKATSILDFADATEWDATAHGLITRGIQLTVDANPLLAGRARNCRGEADNDSAGCLGDSTTILIDGWGVASQQQARQRVRTLVPATAVAGVADTIAIAGELPLFKGLKKLDGMFGYVDMAVLPDYATNKRK